MKKQYARTVGAVERERERKRERKRERGTLVNKGLLSAPKKYSNAIFVSILDTG